MKRTIALLSSLALSVVFAASALAYEQVTPSQAYSLIAANPNAYIIDVRTAAEWLYVGHPGKNKIGQGAEIEGKIVNIPWLIEHKGVMIVNPSFLSDINEIFKGNPDVLLITMCRSGNRSVPSSKLLEEAGYQVLEMPAGFEGGTDSLGYRTVNGWKNNGLPYNFAAAGGYKD